MTGIVRHRTNTWPSPSPALATLAAALWVACTPAPAPAPDAGSLAEGGSPLPATPIGQGDAGAGQDAGDAGDVVDAHDAGTAPADAGIARDAGGPPDAGTLGDAGAAPDVLSGCAADYQALAARGGPGGIVSLRGEALLPDCAGTRHQAFGGIERVVFLGDSVTVGTPPANLAEDASSIWGALGGFFSDIVTDVDETYRSRLADALAARFSLDPPGLAWRLWNPLAQGEAFQRSSGDFWNCARWGSKTDDLYSDGSQIADCFPATERGKKALVVFTAGGNDLVDLVQLSAEGATDEAIWQRAEATVAALEAAVAHLKDAAQYPAGNLVLFATPFDYTDWSGEISSCAAAGASGLSEIRSVDLFRTILDWLSVEYLRVAEEQGADVAFLLEAFCGHGFRRDDDTLPCYRGTTAERWFDLTCIHPNARGHGEILQRFEAQMGL